MMATKAKSSTEVQLHQTVLVPIGNLVPTKHNPRHFHWNAAADELCANMDRVGLISPVIARPIDPVYANQRPEQTAYELLAGRRRWEAAKKLKWTHIATIVRVLDDREARELTVTENLQREDLTPVEESDGVQSLLDVGWSTEEIADRFGKTAKWVVRRARLRMLNSAWRKAIDEPQHWAGQYSAGHFDAIAALPSEVQAHLFEQLDEENGSLDMYGPLPTVAELQKHIAKEYLHTLAAAPWAMDDDSLVPEAGACTSCPKRSSVEPLLFDDPDPDSKAKTARDRCLDAACWKRKGDELAKRNIAELTVKGKKPLQLYTTPDWQSDDLRKKGVERADDFASAKPNAKGAVQAVVVAGPSTGEMRWVKPRGSSISSSRSSSSASRTPGHKKTDKEKRAALEKRRQVWCVNDVCKIIESVIADIAVTTARSVKEICEDEGDDNLIRFLLAFGTAWNADESRRDTAGKQKHERHAAGWPAFAKLLSATADELAESMVRHVLRVWVKRISGMAVQYRPADCYADAQKMCPLLAIDFTKVRAAAEAAIPTPRSWSATAPAKKSKKPKAAKASTASTASTKSKGKTKKVAGKKKKAGKKPPASKAAKKPKQPNIYEAVASKRRRKPKALAEDDPRRKCRVCGCTWTTPCPGGCSWVEADLCSACEHDPRAKKVNQHIHDTFYPAGIAQKESEQAPLNAHTGKPDPVLGILQKGRKHKPSAAAAAVHERTKDLKSPGAPSKKPKATKPKRAARKAVAV